MNEDKAPQPTLTQNFSEPAPSWDELYAAGRIRDPNCDHLVTKALPHEIARDCFIREIK